MSPDCFTTSRLLVRDWRPVIEKSASRKVLEAELSSILSRPVLQHLPPSMHLDDAPGRMSSWIDARAKECDVLLVQRKDSAAVIGLVILASESASAAVPDLRIGYLFAESAWGQGFASELLEGLVAWTGRAGPVRLVGGVGKDNPASARVLEKAGFRIEASLSTHETDVFVREVG